MPTLSPRRQKMVSDLNVTNFIDVILTVLIIFMITAPMMTKDKEEDRTDDPVEKVEELKVDLPDPAISAGRSDEKAPISIGLDADGTFYYGTVALKRNDLQKRLHEIALVERGRHVRVEVDRRTPSGYLIELLDLFAYEGIADFGIHTRMRHMYDQPFPSAQ